MPEGDTLSISTRPEGSEHVVLSVGQYLRFPFEGVMLNRFAVCRLPSVRENAQSR
jgi:hypothetical protein